MSHQSVAERRALLEKELQRYVQILVKEEKPEKVIVFGSLATGKVNEWSDIDLIVINETQLPYLERLYKIQALIQPQVGVDILYYTPKEFQKLCGERAFFQEEIVKKGKVVYIIYTNTLSWYITRSVAGWLTWGPRSRGDFKLGATGVGCS